jgi:hypothetical protein
MSERGARLELNGNGFIQRYFSLCDVGYQLLGDLLQDQHPLPVTVVFGERLNFFL